MSVPVSMCLCLCVLRCGAADAGGRRGNGGASRLTLGAGSSGSVSSCIAEIFASGKADLV